MTLTFENEQDFDLGFDPEEVAAAVINVFERRNEIDKGYKIKREPAILRHFTVQLDKV